MQLIVTVKLLNKRSLIPQRLPDAANIAGVVKEGFSFEGVLVDSPNPNMGVWYQDRDGYYYWGGGVNEVLLSEDLPSTFEVATGAEEQQTFSWFEELNIATIWQQFNEQGEEVTIAVLDTGYDLSNGDLKDAVVDSKQFDHSVPDDIHDQQGHGTFCASILSSRNKFSHIIGIAPKSKLLVGKISHEGGLEPTGLEIILDGIEWAVQSGAEVISISFGKFPKELPNTPGYLDGLQNRLEQIIANKKVLIFSSSGDNPPGIILTKDRFPASFPSCISVGASHLGSVSKVTVLSNHTKIHSEGENVESYGLGNNVIKLSGTSMSTPMVAGVAALAISHLKKKNQGAWDPNAIRKAIYDSGKTIPGTNKKLIDSLSFFNML